MTFREYLQDHFFGIVTLTITTTILFAFLLLTGTSKDILTLSIIFLLIIFISCVLLDFYKKKRKIAELKGILQNLEEKQLFVECIAVPTKNYDKAVYMMMKAVSKATIETVSIEQKNVKEYREYVENWVHEIKVPITTIQLICENNKSENSRKILTGLIQIEENVERALYYARSENVEKDFIITQINISAMIKNVLAKYRDLLIKNDIKIELSGVEKTVYTDPKWTEFMLSQVLSNAIKYRKSDSVIKFSTKDEGDTLVLSIKGNGVGIKKEDLPRVFNKGFTGHNGRVSSSSTGMGLYISKKLSQQLNISLALDSEENEYTEVFLGFKPSPNLTTM